jgi:putative DNA primase/helicase
MEESGIKNLSKKQITPGMIARILLEKYHFSTIKAIKNEDILIYDDSGIYLPGGEVIIRENVQRLCGDNANNHFVNEVVGHIKRSTYIDKNIIDEGDNILNVKNGLVNMKECTLSKHTPHYHSFIQLPVEFDKNAKCDKVNAFLNSIFSKNDAETIKEFIGFLLIKTYMFHKALMITGVSHSGKTTLVNLIIKFVGIENISSVTLQDLCDKPFSTAELCGKVANISDDLPSSSVKYAGQFKRLTGESVITAERKFKDPFTFVNNAKAIFTCNELPSVAGGDDAYFYRWLIVETSAKFNRENCNRNILREITTKQEMSGLLNLALKYRARLLKQNDFSYAKNIDQSRERYILTVMDSVSKFTNEYLQLNKNEWVSKSSIYEYYRDWCSDNDIMPKSVNSFHRRLQKIFGNSITEFYPVVMGEQIRAYRGIILKKE